MIANQWQPSRRFELAEKWGIGPDAVQACSAEAHRIARGYYPTPDESRVTVINDLNEAIAMAKEMRMPGEIIKGAMGMAKVTGCEAPQKVAITDAKGEDLSPVQKQLAHPGVAAFAVAHGRLPTASELEAIYAAQAAGGSAA